ncbi:ShlB/FhaC/HecB family hemolysin secretion/activation protein [Pseudomonas guariconensis]|uniref:ShlB/FhaC/HecB family hemolysin secretion/activation protein n=1 Tax=Pseudomonas guariconensis TaxID=1288410 RepID=UPI003871C152
MRPLVVTLLMVSGACVCHAGSLPSVLDGNEVERRLPTANLPIDTYRPLPAEVRMPAAEKTAPAWPLNTSVAVRKVRLEGGTVYLLSELREHYQHVVGHQVTLAELIAVTDRLTERYRRDGYLLSRAYLPPQDFADGRVHVVLEEGYIGESQVHGEIGPAVGYLEQILDKLKAERPLTRESFERYTGLIGRMPGVSVEAELQPTGRRDGAMRLIVHVGRKPFGARLTLAEGSRTSAQALMAFDSQAQTRFAEQLSARVLLPPGDDEAHYYRLDYSQYLDAEGSRLLLSASRFRSEPRTYVPLDDGENLRQRWDSERLAIGVSQALIVKPDEWLDVVGQFYTTADHVDWRTADPARQDDSDTYARAVSFEGDWRKVEDGRLRRASAGVHQGLDLFGARSDSARDVDFLRLRLSGLQRDALARDWQGVVSGAVYWSGNDLPDSERLLFGGQHFGRGYPADQASGDKGWGLAYELDYSVYRDGAWVRLLQPYLALDAARAWSNGRDLERARLASAALGVRIGDRRFYNLAVELAKPLADVAQDSLDRSPRIMVNLSVSL